MQFIHDALLTAGCIESDPDCPDTLKEVNVCISDDPVEAFIEITFIFQRNWESYVRVALRDADAGPQEVIAC